MVDFLRQNRVKATFFMGGKWMLSHRDRAQQVMTDPLFEVANHSWEHRNLRTLSGRALIDEIKNAQLAYEQVRAELEAKQCTRPGGTTVASEQAPKRLGLMRFPYGACSAAALNEVAQEGLLPIQWDVSSGDPTFGVSAAAVAVSRASNINVIRACMRTAPENREWQAGPTPQDGSKIANRRPRGVAVLRRSAHFS